MLSAFKKTFKTISYSAKYASEIVSNQLGLSSIDRKDSSDNQLAFPTDQVPFGSNEPCSFDTILQSADCVIRLFSEDTPRCERIIRDLISKFSILSDDKLSLEQRGVFNWFENSKYYQFLQEANPNGILLNEAEINISEMKSEFGLLSTIIESFFSVTIPLTHKTLGFETKFNTFFDMIYYDTIKTALNTFDSNVLVLGNPIDGNTLKDDEESAWSSYNYLSKLASIEYQLSNQYTVRNLMDSLINIGETTKNIFEDLNISPDPLIENNLSTLLAASSFLIEDNSIDQEDDSFYSLKFMFEFNGLIANILRFLSGTDSSAHEVVFKKSLTSDNIQVLSAMQPYLIGYDDVNFFDFNHENFQYYFIVHMVAGLTGFKDARIPDNSNKLRLTLNAKNQLDLFRDDIERFLSFHLKDLIFSEKHFEFCQTFLQNPDSEEFNQLGIRDIFTDLELQEMYLYNMFDGKIDPLLEEVKNDNSCSEEYKESDFNREPEQLSSLLETFR